MEAERAIIATTRLFLFLFSFIVEFDEFYRIIKISMNSGIALFIDIIQDSWIMYIIDG